MDKRIVITKWRNTGEKDQWGDDIWEGKTLSVGWCESWCEYSCRLGAVFVNGRWQDFEYRPELDWKRSM
jgi:hypothetical protein